MCVSAGQLSCIWLRTSQLPNSCSVCLRGSFGTGRDTWCIMNTSHFSEADNLFFCLKEITFSLCAGTFLLSGEGLRRCPAEDLLMATKSFLCKYAFMFYSCKCFRVIMVFRGQSYMLPTHCPPGADPAGSSPVVHVVRRLIFIFLRLAYYCQIL